MRGCVPSSIKHLNRETVFKYLATHDQTSKAEIAKQTGISGPTVLKIIDYLMAEQLVTPLGEGKSLIGRKPQILSLNRDFMYFASFFIEGKFLTMGIVDITNTVIYSKMLEVPSDFNQIMYQITFGLLESLFKEADLPLAKLGGIGIAIPGAYNIETKQVITAPLLGIDGPTDIGLQLAYLETQYRVPVIVENDTNVQCLGEYRARKFSQNQDLIFISLGTGLGAGLILDGKLRRGLNSMCGEIGYMVFLDEDLTEAPHSGWLEKRIGYHILEKEFHLSELIKHPNAYEKEQSALIEYLSRCIALCIHNIMMLLDTVPIVLGGVTVNLLGDRLLDAVNEKLSTLNLCRVSVVKQTCDDVGLIGIGAKLTEQIISKILRRPADHLAEND